MNVPRLTKKMVSLTVAGSLSLSLLGAANGAAAGLPASTAAADITGHWAEKDIAQWIADGLIKGYEDGSFQPDKEVTRAEFIALVNRAFRFAEAGSAAFKDLPAAAWSYADVQKAVKAGYITGFSDGSVHPDAPITRQEIALVVERLLGLTPSVQDAASFKDAASIPSWSKGAIGTAKANGIMSGYEDNAFRPANKATRAEAVVILSHALQTKAAPATFDKGGVYGPETGTRTIAGDVVISAAGVTLRNTVVEGNLTFAAGVGEGDATLDHVTVKGTTLVQGGGAHSIHVEDSVLLTIVVDKSTGTVRIVAEGTTTVASVVMQTGATLEESGLTGEGFTDVKLSGLLPQGALITLVGSFDDVDVSSVKVKIAIPSGSVRQITVDEHADGNGFDLGSQARAVNLVLYAAVQFVGGGTIESVKTMNQAAKDSSTFETHPSQMQDAVGSVYYPPPPSSGLNQQQIDALAAERVSALIAALPVAVDLTLAANEAGVGAAKDAFAALTTAQQALVTAEHQTKLSGAVARIAALNADKAAAELVIAKIAALPATANLELWDEPAVNEANAAFASLTQAQQDLILPADQAKLSDAVTRIAELKADKAAAALVTSQITALPATASLALTDETIVNEAKDAFARLTAAQKQLISSVDQTKLGDAVARIAELKADRAAADAVIARITSLPAIGSLTLQHETAVNEARDAFARLTAVQQALVLPAEQTRLRDAVARIAALNADKDAADAVNALIAALPDAAQLQLTDEAVVHTAKTAFNALTAEQKALVSQENQAKLTAADTRIAKLNADKDAADAVTDQILALPPVAGLTLANETAVHSAKFAYDALTLEQQALVSSDDAVKLSSAVARIAQLHADKAEADLVADQIKALPVTANLTLANEAAVNAASGAYAALTADQQAFVSGTDFATLQAAIAKIAELKADQAAANAVIAQIAALLPIAELTLADEAGVTAASAAYNGLTAVRQALVTNHDVLVQAEAKIYELHHPSLKSLAIASLDFATIAAVQAQGQSLAVPASTDFTGNNTIDFTIAFTYANVPREVHVLLNWNIAPNGFTPGEIVGGVVDSFIQQYCLDNGIDLMQRPIEAFGAGNTFIIRGSAPGSQGTFTVKGSGAVQLFGAEKQFAGTDTNTSKNRTFTVGDGTHTATIVLSRAYATIDSLVSALNTQLRNASVAAVAAKIDGSHFSIAPNNPSGPLTIGGTDKGQFFSAFQING
ncbi:S-layer homology domain-containing protein [Paenibacillus sacheonensis]|uniref:SLH domain-containing protein n=1 Tax=Paenibacillus sacheonensis TaxID=742054 RepID=A0A7X4YVK4_9BACL|nr:S-layer homology domain-containing protein [Paenibacillus sacheonensis]MBM7568698.1 hypothetical protein [Paenibacillus sacheonensis]NBC72411.1 hypothetical protein [Paenibacillus sacheonensis]